MSAAETARSSATNLDLEGWRKLAANHLLRARRWTGPAKQRRASGKPHPVEDFLFTYYRHSFAKLEEWHPGVGVKLEAPPAPPRHFSRTPYRQEAGFISAEPELLTGKPRERLRWIHTLLCATRDRPPNFACHGLHEWAMVYRGAEIRHTIPLRLPQAEIDAIVESRVICCSHFDAFRFFHRDAQPLNRLQPELLSRRNFEQPGCVHTNMDLYKWSAKSAPWAGSELVLDCFELALRLRELDMRASPYDLASHGYPPVEIETAEGRREYEYRQRTLAAEAVPLRERLIGKLERVLKRPDTSPAG